MDHDDLFKRLFAALEPGMKITIEKPAATKPARVVVSCEFCEWAKDYSRADNAEKARKKHYKTCEKRKEVLNRPPQWLIEQTNAAPERETKPNGRKKA